jgi:RNA polymerase sigma-54 factor
MALAQRLNLRQSQSLVMTPQLMQSIKLLQLSNIELSAFVEAEVERNPLIELASDDLSTDRREPSEAAQTESGDRAELQVSGEFEGAAEGVTEQFDTDVDNVYTADGPAREASVDPSPMRDTLSSMPSHNALSSQEYDFETVVAEQRTLHDHLNDQIALLGLNAADRLIAAELLESVDDAGYARADITDIAERLGTELENVTAVLSCLQTLEPSGVFARNLSECLALQLGEKNRLDPVMQIFLDNLDLLGKRDFPALKRLCGVDHEDIVDMVQEIRALDPKPGTAFSSPAMQAIVPDVIVKQAADGSWAVELNSESLPRVLVNREYHATVSRSAKGEQEKEFLADCLQTANWLTKSLDQRARTILKVAAEIVAQQDGFLVHGVEFLRPMNLKQIAEAIEMHDSTVSRVTSNKYMLTHRGIFELKYFFTSGVGDAGGGDGHSAEAVKHRIRQMIDAEPASKVLSDDALVSGLEEAGIEIARRTVAKYREAMGIPSSVQRRREKKAMARAS